MQGYKRPGTLIAEIQMKRAQGNCAVLVVEGPDDRAFWSPHKAAECEVVVGEGKRNVIGCMVRLADEATHGILAVVDADYDVLMGVETEAPNVLMTDAHDLECMLCRAPALDKVVGEFGTAEKTRGLDVRSALLERGLAFGRVRWALARLEQGTTEDIELPRVAPLLQQVVDQETWRVDGDRLRAKVQEVLGEDADLSDAIAKLPDADPWYVVHGHDMVALLRLGFLRVLGDMQSKQSDADIARSLRLATSSEDLRATTLGAEMQAWEKANPPYVVLRG